MHKLFGAFGNIRMTSVIMMLVMGAIFGSTATLSGVIYYNLHQRSLADSSAAQEVNLNVAATILERRLPGSAMVWNEDGTTTFNSWGIPALYNTEVIDSVTRVIHEDATLYAFDPAAQTLVGKTTSLANSDGERLTDLVIAADHPVYQAMLAKEAYFGRFEVNGEPFLAGFQPMVKTSGDVVGAIFVGKPLAAIEGEASSVLWLILAVGAATALVLGICGFFLSRLITRPIPRLAHSMEAIAEGDFEAEVPFTAWGNEVGAMARAVEVFRQNGLRVSQMTEAEAARIVAEAENRQQMMSELQRAFGDVVDAAAAGDFTGQVSVEFADPELNALAGSVNNLVGTFNRGVSEIGSVLGAMADTDLTRRMDGHYEGAFARLKDDVNAVADKLTEVVGQLRVTSGSLKTATGELLSGANDLSERTGRQAATIEETSAAMEQLASTVLRNAQRAKQASANAGEVTRTAEQGGQVMDAATAAMERITQSSSKISNIIGMIDDIAFQTNLLALNASVEAARAGDAGKGFAVVAVEVRRLAQSAAQASSEVKALIEQSSGEVNSGSKLVGEAAAKLKLMLDAVRGNSGLLDFIADDSHEQASAIEEVTTAVRTMDEMTQHNAALVEETNAAIEQTEAQATELDRIVDIFHLDQPANDLRPAPAPAKGAGSARGLQQRLAATSARLGSQGNAALSADWDEF